MADVIPVISAAEAPATPKKALKAKKEKKAPTGGKPRAKSSHPPTATMVNNAIQHLKERGGSSLQAIKKYIAATYKVDAEKFSPFIKKYLKSSVTTGALVQTKGKGASGSFKLATTAVTKTAKKIKKPVAKAEKPKVAPVVAKKSPAKKVAKPKKSPAKKPAAAVKPKSPSKIKKIAKVPTKKPKSPKPKSVKPKVAATKSSKRTAPKRK